MEKFVSLKQFLIMSKLSILGSICILFFIGGCASINIPEYIQDENPYKHKFYASFEGVYSGVLSVLEEDGWTVEKEVDPIVFERNESGGDLNKQTLIITEVRPISLFLGTRYARLNIYLRENKKKDITEIEIRYITINSTLVKTFQNYKHNHAVSRLFDKIENKLAQ